MQLRPNSIQATITELDPAHVVTTVSPKDLMTAEKITIPGAVQPRIRNPLYPGKFSQGFATLSSYLKFFLAPATRRNNNKQIDYQHIVHSGASEKPFQLEPYIIEDDWKKNNQTKDSMLSILFASGTEWNFRSWVENLQPESTEWQENQDQPTLTSWWAVVRKFCGLQSTKSCEKSEIKLEDLCFLEW